MPETNSARLAAEELRRRALEANDIELHEEPVPEWDLTLYLRSLRGDEYDFFQKQGLEKPGTKDQKLKLEGLRALMITLGACDHQGNRVFSNPGDVKALGRKNNGVLDRIANRIRKLSGIGAEAVEEMEKNSESAPSDDS